MLILGSPSPVVVLPLPAPSSFTSAFEASSSSSSAAAFVGGNMKLSRSLPTSFTPRSNPALNMAPKGVDAYAARFGGAGLEWKHSTTPDGSTTSTTTCSRKRSREEYLSTDDVDEESESLGKHSLTPTRRQDEDYLRLNGQGGTQGGGCWTVEGDQTALSSSSSSIMATARPIIRSRRKMQRLDSSSSSDFVLLSTSPNVSSVSFSASPPKSQPMEPPVDDFTLRLGIGWRRISDDIDGPQDDVDDDDHTKQAAARGWARYINNHFPGISGARILLQSKSLNDAFLVVTEQGFFLFDEDLTLAKLVGRTEEQAVRTLTTAVGASSGAMSFTSDGEEEVLRANASPRREDSTMQFHLTAAVDFTLAAVGSSPSLLSSPSSSPSISPQSQGSLLPHNTMAAGRHPPLDMCHQESFGLSMELD